MVKSVLHKLSKQHPVQHSAARPTEYKILAGPHMLHIDPYNGYDRPVTRLHWLKKCAFLAYASLGSRDLIIEFYKQWPIVKLEMSPHMHCVDVLNWTALCGVVVVFIVSWNNLGSYNTAGPSKRDTKRVLRITEGNANCSKTLIRLIVKKIFWVEMLLKA